MTPAWISVMIVTGVEGCQWQLAWARAVKLKDDHSPRPIWTARIPGDLSPPFLPFFGIEIAFWLLRRRLASAPAAPGCRRRV